MASDSHPTMTTTRNKICLIYPTCTLAAFTQYFPTHPVTKHVDESVLMGRNNQDYPLDLTLMDARISRQQAHILFDTKSRYFKLVNLTQSPISVDNVNLYDNDFAILRHDSVIRFERLATGKVEHLDFIQFRCAVNVGAPDKTNFTVQVISEKDWSASRDRNPAQALLQAKEDMDSDIQSQRERIEDVEDRPAKVKDW